MWPRRSWVRSIEYLKKRVLRLAATPHAIALGFAFGVFASCTPFIGLHFLIAAALAFLLGGNLLASAIGTAFGNPLTFPVIWATTFKVGYFVMPHPQVSLHHAELSYGLFMQSLDRILPVFTRMLVGSIPVGLLTGIVCYAIVRSVAGAYQEARRRRFDKRVAQSNGSHPADGVRDPV